MRYDLERQHFRMFTRHQTDHHVLYDVDGIQPPLRRVQLPLCCVLSQICRTEYVRSYEIRNVQVLSFQWILRTLWYITDKQSPSQTHQTINLR